MKVVYLNKWLMYLLKSNRILLLKRISSSQETDRESLLVRVAVERLRVKVKYG